MSTIKYILAVGSGKGGVGKSTVSVNLAVALGQAGANVGLLDADVYGPNVPMMMGLNGSRGQGEGTTLVPLEKFGIRVMSIGFFIDPKEPVIWRGPMLHGAMQKFLKEVAWGELDYLIVDLPPGTGDVQLSLCQLIPLAGAVLVTTPQEVALLDVVKAIKMFEKVNVPILGVIENMTELECPTCHTAIELFGRGGGDKLANEFHVPVLGRIGMDPRVREGGDRGEPIVVEHPDAPVAKAFRQAAQAIVERVQALPPAAPEPIVTKLPGMKFEV